MPTVTWRIYDGGGIILILCVVWLLIQTHQAVTELREWRQERAEQRQHAEVTAALERHEELAELVRIIR